MTEPLTAAAALDAPAVPRGAPIGRPHVRETVFARDRAGALAVLATTRPSGRGGGKWYWSFGVYEQRDGSWWDAYDGNGDQWPLDPDAPRPDTPGFELTTGVTGSGDDERTVAVIGGVVGTPVATLEMATEVDRHRVPVDPVTGSFTALALPADVGTFAFTLTALDEDGAVIDRIDYDASEGWGPSGLLFHLSPCENRSSIREHGLDAQRMGASPGLAGSERAELQGVYVFPAPDEAKWWAKTMGERHVGGLDLWQVVASGLPVLDGPHGFDYVPGTIPPERISLRLTFTAEQLAEMAAGGSGPDVFDSIDGVNGAVILPFDDPSGSAPEP